MRLGRLMRAAAGGAALLLLAAPGCTDTADPAPEASKGKNRHELPPFSPFCLEGLGVAGNGAVGGQLDFVDEFGSTRWGSRYRASLLMQEEQVAGEAGSQLRAFLDTAAVVYDFEVVFITTVAEVVQPPGLDRAFFAHLLFAGRYVYPLMADVGTFARTVGFAHAVQAVDAEWEGQRLRVNVWATLGYDVVGELTANSSALTLAPYVRTDAVASLVGGGQVGVGEVSGAVALLDVALPGTVSLLSGDEDGVSVVRWNALTNIVARSLHGKIEASLTNSWGRVQVEEVLADWDGEEISQRAFAGQGVVDVGTGTRECEEVFATVGPPTDFAPVVDPAGEGSVDELLERVRMYGADSDRPPPVGLLAALARRIEADDAAIETLIDVAQTDELVQGAVLSALGAAESGEAAQALLELAEDDAVQTELRIRALAAVGLSPAARGDAALRTLALGTVTDASLRQTASYAAGNIAASVREEEPAMADEVTAVLLARFASAPAAERAGFVGALANTGHPAARVTLERVATTVDEAGTARIAALVGLRHHAEADATLGALAGHDPDPVVMRLAGKILATRTH